MNEEDISQPDDRSQAPPDMLRRRLCQAAIGGTAVVSAAAAGYPLVAFLRLPRSFGADEQMEVPLDQLVEGYAYWGEHRGRQIVVIKVKNEIRAFDGTCTHLGCIVRWDSAAEGFRCPCHNAAFDDLGNPIAGPANTPLRRVKFVIKDNMLEIRDTTGRA